MKTICILIIWFCILPVFSFSQVKVGKKEMKFRLEAIDSTEVYSRSPNRPFHYGYAYDKAQCIYHFNKFSELIDLHEGDKVAEVGAASGWIDGALSVICDSIIFVAEDIDPDFLNAEQYAQVLKHFNAVRACQQTNTLGFVMGKRTKTNLPDTAFDKIFINNAFHEIKRPKKILADIRKKLKADGVLIISDAFSSPYSIRYAKGCETKVKTVDWLEKIAKNEGLYLYDRKAPAFAKDNTLFFSKTKREMSSELTDVTYEYEHDIEIMEVLATIDTNYIKSVFEKLIANQSKIKTVYPELDDYLYEIVDFCIEKKQNENALTISHLAMELYPKSESILSASANACEASGYLQRALEYFEKAAELNISPDEYAEDIKRVKESIEKK